MSTTGLRVVIAGASGMIGLPLQALLAERGHIVHTLVRRSPQGPTEHQWNPATGVIFDDILERSDVVVNLAAASIGKLPWTLKHKELIMSSRRETTGTLAHAIANASSPPRALIQGTAVGFYGERGDEDLTEKSSAGDGYLAEVVQEWEKAALPAKSAKTRVVFARTGLVIGRGGAMAPLRLQTALGVAGPIGRGTQWWPWISLHDEVRALAFLCENSKASGPINLVAPNPATANTVTRSLAKEMKRPFWLGLPRFAISLVLGEGGRSLLLTSQKIHPTQLEKLGFEFADPTIEDAIAGVVGG